MLPEIYKQFGLRLQQARNKAGLSQQEIAAKLGIAQTTYSGYEQGIRKIPLETIMMLSSVLNINPDNLILGTETEIVPSKSSESVKSNSEEDLSNSESKIIKKYRLLDQRGQQAVLDTLNREYSYISKEGIDLAEIAIDAVNTIDKLQEDLPINQSAVTSVK